MRTYSAIIGLTALMIAGCAAMFSVFGLAHLFGGNFWYIVIMAGSLEIGKLVCASVAYRSRKYAPKWVKSLLVFFTIVMMFITSLGIFGFLSQSYEQVARQIATQDLRIEALEDRKERFERTLARYESDREEAIEDRRSQRDAVASVREQYNERGWATDLQTLERAEDQLARINENLSTVDERISSYSDSVSVTQENINQIRIEDDDVTAELGPLVFIARQLDRSTDDAALWLMIILIFVFDPMAVTLVVAFNIVREHHGQSDLEESLFGDGDYPGEDTPNILKAEKHSESDEISVKEKPNSVSGVENNEAKPENSDPFIEEFMEEKGIDKKEEVDPDEFQTWAVTFTKNKKYKRSKRGGVKIENQDPKSDG